MQIKGAVKKLTNINEYCQRGHITQAPCEWTDYIVRVDSAQRASEDDQGQSWSLKFNHKRILFNIDELTQLKIIHFRGLITTLSKDYDHAFDLYSSQN